MSKNDKKPSIRFKGYTDTWEQRKLGDVTDSYSGGTPTAGKKEYYDGDIPFIRSGEISSDKTELFITEEGLNSSSAKMIMEGDILYALYGATSGEVGISKLKGAINQAILAIQPHQHYDIQFIMQWLRKSKECIINTYLQGGQGNLSGNIVKELSVDLPTYDEQKQIGDYFEKIDNLITLHQRKYEKLVSVKKSMLEKMFPRDGQKVPEIRFFGFTDPWEQRKASQLGDFSKGNGYSKSDLREKGTPIILYGRMYTKYEFTIQDVDTFAEVSDNAVFSQGNEVIIPASGETAEDIARASAVEKSGFLLGGDLNIVRPFSFINPTFFAMAISNGTPQKELAKKAQGKSVVHIHNSDIQEVQISYPKLEEQRQIVSLFRNLDNLITLHQRELEKLKNIKKSLLEKMFI